MSAGWNQIVAWIAKLVLALVLGVARREVTAPRSDAVGLVHATERFEDVLRETEGRSEEIVVVNGHPDAGVIGRRVGACRVVLVAQRRIASTSVGIGDVARFERVRARTGVAPAIFRFGVEVDGPPGDLRQVTGVVALAFEDEVIGRLGEEVARGVLRGGR